MANCPYRAGGHCCLVECLCRENDTSQAVPYASGERQTVAERPDTPTLWRDMTDAEKGALLLAHHEGKVIEATRLDVPDDWRRAASIGLDKTAYRIKPEPKVEFVEAYAQAALDGGFEVSSFADYWDWRITFNTIDGEPDPASIKMECLRD